MYIMKWTDKAKKILEKYFNYSELKDKQFEVINEFLLNHDVVGLLPTSYGKSMCYILPPLLTKKIMFIISPLISLMDDQKDKLVKANIPVAALHGNNKNKQQEIFDIIDNKIKIVFMSPEFLIEGDGIELANTLYEQGLLGYLAVDESHCLSSWGHDFRPQYMKLKVFRERFPSIPIMALTATAKKHVVSEIIKTLDMKDVKIISANFDRPNLYISCKERPKETIIVKKKMKEKEVSYEDLIVPYLEEYKDDKIIIYVYSRKDTEEVAEVLLKYCNCKAYHAGLPKNKREEIQSEFISGKIKVIISTIAFGMGIDQIVKCVIVFGCPSSIEEYYQQIGRGGRDGKPCHTVMYFSKSSYMLKKNFIKKETYNPLLRDIKEKNLYQVYNFFEIKTCRRRFILEYLDSTNYFDNNAFYCNNCDNCQNKLFDFTEIFYNHFVKNIEMNKELINMFSENKIYDKKFSKFNQVFYDWRDIVKDMKFKNIPENLKIKLPFDNIEIEEDLFTKYENMINKII
jgi:ATP-dependent DNA helicase RecQ